MLRPISPTLPSPPRLPDLYPPGSFLDFSLGKHISLRENTSDLGSFLQNVSARYPFSETHSLQALLICSELPINFFGLSLLKKN